MTENPDDKSDTSAIDEAATASATGGYTVNSGGNGLLLGRNDGADHSLNLMHGPQAGLPDGTLEGAHAGALPIGAGGHGFAGGGAEPLLQQAPNAIPWGGHLGAIGFE